jgi:hypothetical protein
MCCGHCSALRSVFLSIAAIAVTSVRWVPHWQQWDFCNSGLGFHAEMNAALRAKVAGTVANIRRSNQQEKSITKNVFSAWIAFRSIKILSAVIR